LPAKKKTASKSAPSRKGNASGSSRSSSAGKKPVRREVWSFICFFLAIFSFLGFFNIKAIFIDFFSGILKGFLGYGSYVMTFMLLCASAILLFHRGRPVRLRVWCCLSLSAVISAILHLFLSKTEYSGGFVILKNLYLDGALMKSGGVLGGLSAIGLKIVFSKIGAAILLIGGALLLFVLAFNISIVAILEYIFKREKPRYELVETVQKPAEEPVRKPARPAAAPSRTHAAPPVIDIPLDDGPVGASGYSAAKSEPSSKGFFRKRTPGVRTPDEVIAGSDSMKPLPDPLADTYTVNNTATHDQAPPQTAKTESASQPQAAAPIPAPLDIAALKQEEKLREAENEEIKRKVAEEIQSSVSTETKVMYSYPPFSLLTAASETNTMDATAELKLNASRLTDTIKSFGIEARLINVTRGPSVTRYELEMDRGIKLTKLTGLADDIALSLGASGVRIAPIPDKVAVVGIEVPNKLVSTVRLREVLESKEFINSRSRVSFAIGKDISGECIVGDISRLPHLLIAGTTGSGKSVCMNSLIISLLYKATPDEVRLIMIDPKMIELNIYNGIPHLLIPVVTDPRKASGALQWAVSEMMNRYKLFAEHNVRDIAQYNEAAAANNELDRLPQIVIVIDELADLMLVAAKEVEESVCRIAQMARAAGMHLIIATQRPSADVITGIMKANIPSRIAFAVASQLESRIILDTTGAEKLAGKGDMLYYPLGAGKPHRVQGCLISSAEVERVVDFVKKSGKADYSDEVMEHIERSAVEGNKGSSGTGEAVSDADEMLPQAVEVILETGQASVSMLQRRLKLGYARAARLVDQLESRGIVGPFEGAKPRALLITKEQWEEMKLQNPQYQ